MGERVNLVRPAAVIVLAAGEGKRMRSRTPKVLHPIAGRTLLDHVLAAVAPLGAPLQLVVVGHERDQVVAAIDHHAAAVEPGPGPWATTFETVAQDAPRGTGHAVRTALAAAGPFREDDVLVVVPGDAPLLTPETLALLVARHAEAGAAATLLTAVLDDPTGYGRVVRDEVTGVRAVVEQPDADAEVAAIREVATSVYAFQAGPLADALTKLSTANAQGEEYLTDVIAMFAADGRTVAAHVTTTPEEAAGVNDRAQLAAAGRLMRDRIVARVLAEGTTVVDPATTWIDAGVTFEPDSTILPNTYLHGATHIASGAVVGPDTTLTDTIVGPDAKVSQTTADRSEIGPAAVVGPYTHLRAGTRLGRGGKIGAYVETKNAEIADGAKVPHLAYVGDATVGEGANIGCGTIFANYDGVTKRRSVVGPGARIGSATVIIAPVVIGAGAYTGAGAVVKWDVPPGALAVREGAQRTIPGWVQRRRAGTASARAADAAPPSAPDGREDGTVRTISDNGQVARDVTGSGHTGHHDGSGVT
jgi:bifunctional UDP-N-acetylglucosamine pyrophosphorylase/glucosamine-1-phosphate N-acetyltransferase